MNLLEVITQEILLKNKIQNVNLIKKTSLTPLLRIRQ